MSLRYALLGLLHGTPMNGYTIKALFNEATGVDRLGYHLDRELENLVRSADGPEFAEGIEAFFSRRAPRFPEP